MNNILMLAVIGVGIYIYMKSKNSGAGSNTDNKSITNSGGSTTMNNANTTTMNNANTTTMNNANTTTMNNANTTTTNNADTTTTNNANASATSFENMTPQQQADVVWKKVQQIIKDAEILQEDVEKKYRAIKKSNPLGCLDKNNPDHHYEDIKKIMILLNDNGTLEYLDSPTKVNLVKHWVMILNSIINSYYIHKGKI